MSGTAPPLSGAAMSASALRMKRRGWGGSLRVSSVCENPRLGLAPGWAWVVQVGTAYRGVGLRRRSDLAGLRVWRVQARWRGT